MVEDGRVDGVIAISRAIGDWEYKSASLQPEKMAVSGYPDISKTPLTKDIDFILCACDGIWDCMTSQQTVDFVNQARIKLKTYSSKDNQKSPTIAGMKLQKQNSNGSSGKMVGAKAPAGMMSSPVKKTKSAKKDEKLE